MLHKVQDSVARENRIQARKLFLQHNRALHAQLSQQQSNSFIAQLLGDKITPSKIEETYFQHSTILNIMNHQPIKSESIAGLLVFIQDCNWIGQYKAIIGLHNLGSNFINHDNEDEILGMGIVPKVVQLLRRLDHPYIQTKALSVLSQIAQSVSRESFNAYFNEQVIPFEYLMDCLSSKSNLTVENTLRLLAKLSKKRYKIFNDDSNMRLIIILEDVLIRLTSNGQKLTHFISFLVTILPKISQDSKQFDERLFELMNSVIDAQINAQSISEVLRRVAFWLSDGRLIRKICKQLEAGLVSVKEKYPKMINILERMFSFRLDSPCIDPNWWKFFISPLSQHKEGLNFLHSLDILGRIQTELEGDEIKISSIAVEVLSLVIEHSSEQVKVRILSRQNMFASLERIYDLNNQEAQRALGSTVLIMLRNTSCTCSFIRMLIKFNLFRLFLMNCGRVNMNQQNTIFFNIRNELNRIKTISYLKSQYDSLVGVVAESEVQSYLINLLNHNNLASPSHRKYFLLIGLANKRRDMDRFNSGIILVEEISSVGQLQGPFMHTDPILHFF